MTYPPPAASPNSRCLDFQVGKSVGKGSSTMVYCVHSLSVPTKAKNHWQLSIECHIFKQTQHVSPRNQYAKTNKTIRNLKIQLWIGVNHNAWTNKNIQQLPRTKNGAQFRLVSTFDMSFQNFANLQAMSEYAMKTQNWWHKPWNTDKQGVKG